MGDGNNEYCDDPNNGIIVNFIMNNFAWINDLSYSQMAYAYGLQVIILLTLVAITIFRKEMSCNHCYAEQSEENRTLRSTSSEATSMSPEDEGSYKNWDEREAELLLEEAGCYGSGTYTMFVQSINLIRNIIHRNTLITHIMNLLASWWNVAAEEQRLDEILDGADNWCVTIAPPSPPSNILVLDNNNPNDSTTNNNDHQAMYSLFPASKDIPTDAMVHILCYLHPKDIIALACTSRGVKNAIQDESNDLSKALWKSLWLRDYGWILYGTDIGQVALKRSLRTMMISFESITFTQTFYFRFGVSCVNYIIAGHCNRDKCLIGLGGHVYDMTNFLDQHPGSSETVLVHAGRDASSMFESMRHTIFARNLAQHLCVIVDASMLGGIGVNPTMNLSKQIDTVHHGLTIVDSPVVSRQSVSNRPVPSTLECIYYSYIEEQEIYQRLVARLRSKVIRSIVGDVHPYYDPVAEKWRAWYMNTKFESVFIDF